MSDVPGGCFRSEIRSEVVAALMVLARGREKAITGDRLAEVVAARLTSRGLEVRMQPKTVRRRVSESVAELIEAGEPIASSSRPPLGYWWAEVADDLEESLAEADRRARMALRRRRFLRRRIFEMRGQERLRVVDGASDREPSPEAGSAPAPAVQLGLLVGGVA